MTQEDENETVSATLYQFPISHYCDKARWALEARGVPFRAVNLLPGLHLRTTRRHGGRTVPVYVEGDTVLTDSSAIVMHAESAGSGAPLLPDSEADRKLALEHEAYFDDEVGPSVRIFAYGYLTVEPSLLAGPLYGGYSAPVRLLGRLFAGRVAHQIRRFYRINEASIEAARGAVGEAAARIERAIEGDPKRFLVGDRLSVADITAASLLGPLVGPERSPWAAEMPVPALLEARASLRARPAGAWVLARYAERRP
jgi:glutathione S-transferase